MVPLAQITPSTKTLVSGIVAGEMAVFHEPLLNMAASNKVDSLVETHADRVGRIKVSNDSDRPSCLYYQSLDHHQDFKTYTLASFCARCTMLAGNAQLLPRLV